MVFFGGRGPQYYFDSCDKCEKTKLTRDLWKAFPNFWKHFSLFFVKGPRIKKFFTSAIIIIICEGIQRPNNDWREEPKI